MSHHTVQTKSYLYNPPVDVLVNMGWDKPTQGYFMYIGSDNEEICDEEGLLYGNLHDVGTIKDLNYFIHKLIEYRVLIPHEMIYAVIQDQHKNIVNYDKTWNQNSLPENFTSYENYYAEFFK